MNTLTVTAWLAFHAAVIFGAVCIALDVHRAPIAWWSKGTVWCWMAAFILDIIKEGIEKWVERA